MSHRLNSPHHRKVKFSYEVRIYFSQMELPDIKRIASARQVCVVDGWVFPGGWLGGVGFVPLNIAIAFAYAGPHFLAPTKRHPPPSTRGVRIKRSPLLPMRLFFGGFRVAEIGDSQF